MSWLLVRGDGTREIVTDTMFQSRRKNIREKTGYHVLVDVDRLLVYAPFANRPYCYIHESLLKEGPDGYR